MIPTSRFLAGWPAEEGKCVMRDGPLPDRLATDAEVKTWLQTSEGKHAFERLSQWLTADLIGNGLLAEESLVGVPVQILLRYARATRSIGQSSLIEGRRMFADFRKLREGAWNGAAKAQ
jgi:hypothetical protein